MREETDLNARYIARTPTSAALYRRAVNVLPGGVSHDTRYLDPHPLYVDRAAGSIKWDVDGNRYVDYIGGHGALLLGHNHPRVVEAVREQLTKGTHFGAGHELEVLWAEQIQRMVPCAERVRFTSSGTESTLLAIRIARAFSGKSRIVRLAGHFHGWHDQVAFAATAHFDGSVPAGILPELVAQTLVCPPNDSAALARILDERDDVAAVIVEPTGASFGQAPLVAGYLADLRSLTARKQVVLIFDEVITGFRIAPGGAGQLFGVQPDLATFAKVIAGGFPGGAVAGRRDIMDQMTRRADPQWNIAHRVAQQGTFNANPISAAAGLATLLEIANRRAIEAANRAASQLRNRGNELLREASSPWVIYGEHSGFHVFTNPANRTVSLADIHAGRVPLNELKATGSGPLAHEIRCAMILSGVDLFPWPGGCVSAVHGEDDVELTAQALVSTWREVTSRSRAK